MTAVAAPLAAPKRWLFGPTIDLLFGCGGLYFLAFLLIAAVGPSSTQLLPEGLIPLALVFAAVPHYGATLLRVYERSADRRKYALFAVWASLLVWAVFVWGVYDLLVGSLFLTLYLSWSPWHYSGQNYGIGLMLLGRGGIKIPIQAKRLLYASFFTSFLLVLFSTHAAVPIASYSPTPVTPSESAYQYMPLGIPVAVLGPLLLATAAIYLGISVAALVMIRRVANSWADLTPLLGVMLLQGLWFSIPVLARASAGFESIFPLASTSVSYMLLWYAFGHSLQYLWVTTYYATQTGGATRPPTYWLKAYLAGGALFAIPTFLFSPRLLGDHSFESGLGMLIASAVNLHHFVLDGAIWKLRDGRIARILLRKPDAAEQRARTSNGIGRRLAWSIVGGLGVAYGIFYVVGIWELEHGFRRAVDPPDPDRMRLAAARLARVGHDHPGIHLNLAILALRAGDLAEAEQEVERSLALGPGSRAYVVLGQVRQKQQRWAEARDAFEAALAIDARQVPALVQLAAVSEKLGDLERAELALASAVEIAPDRNDLRGRLEQLRRQRRSAAPTSVAPAS
jgi:cytochrome c-type biogenesis protein CcmH/NrfG